MNTTSKNTLEDIGHKVRTALRGACLARTLPFDARTMAGACGPATAALLTALAMAGIPSTWAHGRMLRPEPVDPHTWVMVGDYFVDLTATQAATCGEAVRIVGASSRCYRRTVNGGPSFGPCLDVEPDIVADVTSPWAHEAALVAVVAEAMGAPREDVEPHALAVLWGNESRRRALMTPRSILAEVAALPGLTADDARALAEHARALIAARAKSA
jgi:hypothetical protein